MKMFMHALRMWRASALCLCASLPVLLSLGLVGSNQALAATTAAQASAQSTRSNLPNSAFTERALGKWKLIVTFVDGPRAGQSEIAYVSIGAGNWFSSTSTSDPTTFAVSGCGNWQTTGRKTFVFDFREVALDGSGHILYLVQVHQSATLSDDGNSFESQGTGQLFSPDGQSLGSIVHSRDQAVRVA